MRVVTAIVAQRGHIVAFTAVDNSVDEWGMTPPPSGDGAITRPQAATSQPPGEALLPTLLT
jgi:hypothetical protein